VVVALPLYPRHSRTTTGSSLNEWNRRFQPHGWNPRVQAIAEFHADAGYIDVLARAIEKCESPDRW